MIVSVSDLGVYSVWRTAGRRDSGRVPGHVVGRASRPNGLPMRAGLDPRAWSCRAPLSGGFFLPQARGTSEQQVGTRARLHGASQRPKRALGRLRSAVGGGSWPEPEPCLSPARHMSPALAPARKHRGRAAGASVAQSPNVAQERKAASCISPGPDQRRGLVVLVSSTPTGRTARREAALSVCCSPNAHAHDGDDDAPPPAQGCGLLCAVVVHSAWFHGMTTTRLQGNWARIAAHRRAVIGLTSSQTDAHGSGPAHYLLYRLLEIFLTSL